MTLTGDLGNPHVVVLPCDNMTPGAPVQELDGPATSLYERFLWRLFSQDYTLYERYQPFWSDKSKIAEAIRAINRPVLDHRRRDPRLRRQWPRRREQARARRPDMAFLRALLDVVNDVPHVAMLVVMIASDSDTIALSPAAQDRRDDLNALLERNGSPATVTEVGDFADILRRRLFDGRPPTEVLSCHRRAVRADPLDDPVWTKNVWDPIGANWRGNWNEQVAACYPFHPMLIAIATRGMEPGHRLPASPIDDPDLRRHGLRPAATRPRAANGHPL